MVYKLLRFKKKKNGTDPSHQSHKRQAQIPFESPLGNPRIQMKKNLDRVLFPTICRSICMSCVSKTKASKLNDTSLPPLLRYLQLPTLFLYNSSIQISNRFACKRFLLSFPLYLYSATWSVFRRKCFFFLSLQRLFWLWFSLSNLNWLELPSGFFCKIAIICLFCFWLHLVWLLRKWWKINATKKLVEDFEYWGFH